MWVTTLLFHNQLILYKMKKLSLFLSASLMAIGFASCGGGNNKPNNPNDTTTGTTYPRIHLIEHFTGEDCGFCPLGMDLIYDVYSQNPDCFVWVSNHYGFGSDNYTIAGSSKIGAKLGVDGAPSISLDRMKKQGKYNYHPQTLVDYKYADTAPKTSTTKLELERTYDAATHKLHVTVKGFTSEAELQGVRLTLGVTESGPVGYQHDYYAGWEGWDTFTHTHIIRVYATDPLGEDIFFGNKTFTEDFTITLKPEWKAENCEVVAWATALDTYYPVLNAAKIAVVDGTKGGEDIKHGGIQLTEVDDVYPEVADPAPASTTLDQVNVEVQTSGSADLVTITAVSATPAITVSRGSSKIPMLPFVQIMLLTEKGAGLQAGTYPINDSQTVGTVVAGLRDDVNYKFGGSLYYYVYQDGSSLYIYTQWYMNAGELVVQEDGSFTLHFTTRLGQEVNATYTAPASEPQPTNAPALKLAPYAPYSLLLAPERTLKMSLL